MAATFPFLTEEVLVGCAGPTVLMIKALDIKDRPVIDGWKVKSDPQSTV